MSNVRVPSPDAAVYVISVAAELTGLHPQTLRTYERLGLVTPERTGGGGRRYSLRDVERLREIADLTATGIGLEGVKRILDLENQVAALQARNEELVDELASAHEALRRAALSATKAPTARASRVPALLESAGPSTLVVWRRNQR